MPARARHHLEGHDLFGHVGVAVGRHTTEELRHPLERRARRREADARAVGELVADLQVLAGRLLAHQIAQVRARSNDVAVVSDHRLRLERDPGVTHQVALVARRERYRERDRDREVLDARHLELRDQAQIADGRGRKVRDVAADLVGAAALVHPQAHGQRHAELDALPERDLREQVGLEVVVNDPQGLIAALRDERLVRVVQVEARRGVQVRQHPGALHVDEVLVTARGGLVALKKPPLGGGLGRHHADRGTRGRADQGRLTPAPPQHRTGNREEREGTPRAARRARHRAASTRAPQRKDRRGVVDGAAVLAVTGLIRASIQAVLGAVGVAVRIAEVRGAVLVAVHRRCVELAIAGFVRVRQLVIVGVQVAVVRGAVVVGVHGRGVEVVVSGFVRVADGVVVAVEVERVDGSVAVGVVRARRRITDLVVVRDAVAVGVAVVRIGAQVDLDVVLQAVAVRVVLDRRRARHGGVAEVGGAIVAGVDRRRLEVVVAGLVHVRRAVVVRIQVAVVRRAVVVGVDGGSVQVAVPSLVGVADVVAVAVRVQGVDGAVAVGVARRERVIPDLVAIAQAVVVAVRVRGVGAGRNLVAVVEVVVVRVAVAEVRDRIVVGVYGRRVQVGVAGLVLVAQAVVVGVEVQVVGRVVAVRIDRVRRGVRVARLVVVADRVVVAVEVVRVRVVVAVGVTRRLVQGPVAELLAVGDRVPVGVGVVGVEAVVDLHVVGQAVAVAIAAHQVVCAHVRVRLARVDRAVRVRVLGAVGHRAVVRVGVLRVRAGRRIGVGHEVPRVHVRVRGRLRDAGLRAVEQAVIVAVGVEHVRHTVSVEVAAGAGLVPVEHPVVVGVGVVGVAPDAVLFGVGQAVVVAVRAPVVVRRVVGIPLVGVELAVAVRIFEAVGDAAVVGVRVEGVRGRRRVGVGHVVAGRGVRVVGAHRDAGLRAVAQPVVVAVRVEGVHQAVAVEVLGRLAFGAVEHAVVVGVRVGRVGADARLHVVGQTVAIAVRARAVVRRVVRIALTTRHHAVAVRVLDTIRHAAVVGVDVQRIRHGGRIHVGHEVPGVHVGVRVGLGHAELGAVVQPVVVAVGVQGVHPAIAVGVYGGAGFSAVHDAVVVGVGVVGVGADAGLVSICQAVAVGVGAAHEVVARIIRVALVGVDRAVAVRILETVGNPAVVGIGVQRIRRRGRIGVRREVVGVEVGVGCGLDHTALGAITEAVAVAVRVVRVRVAVTIGVRGRLRLVAVAQTVVVRIGVVRIGPDALFVFVREAVVVVVLIVHAQVVARVVRITLPGVDRAVAVRVLVAVRDGAVVGVRVERVRRRRRIGVRREVAGVQVRVRRRRDDAAFGAVAQAVVVAVGVVGIGAERRLVVVAQAVVVAVLVDCGHVVRRIVRVALARVDGAVEVRILDTVGHTAGVRIRVVGVRSARGIGVGHEVAGVQVRVRAGLGHAGLGAVAQAVVVAVRIQCVDEAVVVAVVEDAALVAVGETVVVAVGVIRVRAAVRLFVVPQAVVVTVVVDDRHVVGRVVRIALARVDRAVEVCVLDAVVDRTAVGVRVQGIGAGGRVRVRHEVARAHVRVRPGDRHPRLGAVEQSVIVAVGIERVDQAVVVRVVGHTAVVAIDYAVVVAVRIVGVGADEGLFVIGQAVVVAVLVHHRHVVRAHVGISLTGVHRAVEVRVLGSVRNGAVVGVGVHRARRGRRIGVGHKIARLEIRVRMRIDQPALGAIEQAVPVAVRVVGVGTPVAVRVRAGLHLVAVDHPVVVRVGVRRIRADAGLVGVRQAVLVGVVAHAVVRTHVRVALARVDRAVRVRVLAAVRHPAVVRVGVAGVRGRERVRVRSEVARAHVRVGGRRHDAGLEAVRQAVVVGVGVVRVAAEPRLVGVAQAVVVRVLVHGHVVERIIRVALVRIHGAVAVRVLVAVRDRAVVGVGVEGVCRRTRRGVGHKEPSAHVGVRIRRDDTALGAVEQAVAIAVGVVRVGLAVVVRVLAGPDLIAVDHTVVVGVRVIGIGPDGLLVVIGQAVTVAIRVGDVVGAHIGVPLAGVDPPVAIEVLGAVAHGAVVGVRVEGVCRGAGVEVRREAARGQVGAGPGDRHAALRAVAEAVGVAVGVQDVAHLVPVGVPGGVALEAVVETVVVGVDVLGIRADAARLVDVREAVAVAVVARVHHRQLEPPAVRGAREGVGVRDLVAATLAVVGEVAPRARRHIRKRRCALGVGQNAIRAGADQALLAVRHRDVCIRQVRVVPVHRDGPRDLTGHVLVHPQAGVGGLDVLSQEVQLTDPDEGLTQVVAAGHDVAGRVAAVPHDEVLAGHRVPDEQDVVGVRDVRDAVLVRIADDAVGAEGVRFEDERTPDALEDLRAAQPAGPAEAAHEAEAVERGIDGAAHPHARGGQIQRKFRGIAAVLRSAAAVAPAVDAGAVHADAVEVPVHLLEVDLDDGVRAGRAAGHEREEAVLERELLGAAPLDQVPLPRVEASARVEHRHAAGIDDRDVPVGRREGVALARRELELERAGPEGREAPRPLARAQDRDRRHAIRREDRELTHTSPRDPFNRSVDDVEAQLRICLHSTVDAELGGALGVCGRRERTNSDTNRHRDEDSTTHV